MNYVFFHFSCHHGFLQNWKTLINGVVIYKRDGCHSDNSNKLDVWVCSDKFLAFK